jgi:uncharacterized protein
VLDHLMLLPTLSCPAACAYCFGPRADGGVMRIATVERIVAWQSNSEGRLSLTFHGGEPLAAGVGFYRQALPLLQRGLAARQPRFSMQSNLWLLDAEIADLLSEYGVSLGTSLDGPEDINDAQRGQGYFQRAMQGIALARRQGLDVGCICTVTPRSLPRLPEIFDFFIREDLNFSLHASLPALCGDQDSVWPLSAVQHGEMLTAALTLYLKHLDRTRVATLDSMCRSLSAGQGGICTFTDCLGRYPAVGPNGNVFTCQRFAALAQYAVANVADASSLAHMHEAPFWRTLEIRQARVKEECGDCAYFAACRGGCPYSALTRGQGSFDASMRDPHCEAFRQFFRAATDRALEEAFATENMNEVVNDPAGGLLRRGRLSSVMRGGPHPRDTALVARRIALAAALGMDESTDVIAKRLMRVGGCFDSPRTAQELERLARQLRAKRRRNNLYLHVTLGCNLRCAHCYAEAGPERLGDDALEVGEIVALCKEASALGFRQAVLTGGEPLLHPDRNRLLVELAAIRRLVKPLSLVVRTNLSLPLSEAELRAVGHCCDALYVSVDGDPRMHDRRRGAGAYDRAVHNMEALLHAGCEAELVLAATLSASEVVSKEGRAVRELAARLGARRVTFKPLKPIGRAVAGAPQLAGEEQLAQMKPEELRCYGFTPTVSCGLGDSLSVEPSGDAYPCNVLCGERWLLGNVSNGLAAVLGAPATRALREHSVDTRAGCRVCLLRYLCGGGCRVWSGTQGDLDSPPLDCEGLHERVRSLLDSALAHLHIPSQTWAASGLPLPDARHGSARRQSATQ